MKLSPFSKPTIEPTERWLTNAKAAKKLGVEARTIKRWMNDPARRNALGAVRHGQQWRIPFPDNADAWEMQTDYRLKAAGVTRKPSWERALEKECKKSSHCQLETYRLWLAAHSQLSATSDGVTQEDITAILLLWQTACKILGSLPRGTEVDKLKSKFPDQLRMRNFPEKEIRSIMSYWPEQNYFKGVRAAHTLEQLENIRSGMDTVQAAKTCKNLGQKPTAGNLRPLLHKNFLTHINDTREELPIGVHDLRQPQNGLKLRTFRNRHPLKKSPLKTVIATVYDVRDGIPGADENAHSGKTPVRDSKLSEKDILFHRPRRIVPRR